MGVLAHAGANHRNDVDGSGVAARVSWDGSRRWGPAPGLPVGSK